MHGIETSLTVEACDEDLIGWIRFFLFAAPKINLLSAP